MKLVTVVGARPQLVKAAVVSRETRRAGVREILVHTGQHYDDNMSGRFFTELEIPKPDHFLGIGSASHGAQTGRMLEAIEPILVAEAPDWVLVYGDTNSTIAGALAAAKLHLRVAHVEAGLRSFNRNMPEEINRILTDHASELLLAPTVAAMANLDKENLGSRAQLVGDVMYDAVLHYRGKALSESSILMDNHVKPGSFVLATVHRAENTDDPKRLRAILNGLRLVAERLPVIFPLHPRTRARVEGLVDVKPEGLRLIDPVGYLDMVMLEQNAKVIATDSGGVQKEAFFMRVPCVTLRNETEWTELLELNVNVLAPPMDAEAVAAAILDVSAFPSELSVNPYGDGKAGERIVGILQHFGG